VATTLVGAVLEALAGDSALQAAFPALPVYRDEAPNEAPLPRVIVTDEEEPYKWVNLSARVEAHKLRLEVFAPAGATAGAPAPAGVIADHVQRVVGWEDVPIPGTTTVRFEQVRRPLKLETRRAPDKGRVAKVVVEYEVEFYRTGIQHAGV
jgi:hypothetical protein